MPICNLKKIKWHLGSWTVLEWHFWKMRPISYHRTERPAKAGVWAALTQRKQQEQAGGKHTADTPVIARLAVLQRQQQNQHWLWEGSHLLRVPPSIPAPSPAALPASPCPRADPAYLGGPWSSWRDRGRSGLGRQQGRTVRTWGRQRKGNSAEHGGQEVLERLWNISPLLPLSGA